ncbi:MAG TPA: protein phosphatase CheZ [Gammaproteobacteria bacterium]|nr:protein phosphatase CheZ [Gammaproteobacteria bacterium]
MADEKQELDSDHLEQARALVAQLEEGKEEEAARLLDELTKQREESLFTELGKLTRQLHEALNSFRVDSRIAEVAEHEFPDARERLKYVITMTEQAAGKTLDAVEGSMPLCDELEQRASGLQEEWGRFTRRELDAEGFRSLSRDVETFLGEVVDGAPRLRGSLQEVLMAQDFQDMTGQIIKRVISLVEDVEESLVELVRISGQNLMPEAVKEGPKKEEEEKEKAAAAGIEATGPAVPGVDAETVSGQDEVDDLLSSLGF